MKHYCSLCRKETKENICVCEECETKLINEEIPQITSEKHTQWLNNEFEETQIKWYEDLAYIILLNKQDDELEKRITKLENKVEK